MPRQDGGVSRSPPAPTLDDETERATASPPPLWGGTGWGDTRTKVGVPPTPNPSPQGGGESAQRLPMTHLLTRRPGWVSFVSDPEDPDGLIPRATADGPAQPRPFLIQCIFGVALRRCPERQRRRSCPWVRPNPIPRLAHCLASNLHAVRIARLCSGAGASASAVRPCAPATAVSDSTARPRMRGVRAGKHGISAMVRPRTRGSDRLLRVRVPMSVAHGSRAAQRRPRAGPFGRELGALTASLRRGDLRRPRTTSCGKCSSKHRGVYQPVANQASQRRAEKPAPGSADEAKHRNDREQEKAGKVAHVIAPYRWYGRGSIESADSCKIGSCNFHRSRHQLPTEHPLAVIFRPPTSPSGSM